MRKVIHLIPYDGMGGVEEAARSMGSFHDDVLDFEIRYLFPQVSSASQRRKTNSVKQILRVGQSLAREAPDLVILSLWRAVATGLIAKLLNPRLKLVLFIHNSRDAHALDKWVTRLGLMFCQAVWADSRASITARFAKSPRKPVAIISYLARKLAPLPRPVLAPVFLFWGRLSQQKNLPRALRLFARIQAVSPQAHFTIIGPDGDDSIAIHTEIAALGLGQNVTLLGQHSFEDIQGIVKRLSGCFYLQTSRYEGMALSVTEAMQLGLVPVVAPVGEIAQYTTCDNAILLSPEAMSEDVEAIDKILALLEDNDRFERMREAALNTWTDSTTYAVSMRETTLRHLEGRV